MEIYSNVLEAIGRTPVIRLKRITRGIEAEVVVKLEAVNIGGSIKSRTALGMIERAEREGRLKPGSIIVEATTGNQGIGVAMVAAVKGYKAIIIMPEHMGKERRKIVKAYGAEVILTPTLDDMEQTVWECRKKAFELEKQDPKYVYLKQFDNPGNPDIHRRTTAAEILSQTDGKLDAFVATIGTAGTLTGVAEVLKVAIPTIKVYGVEPEEASLEGKGKKGLHKQQGIGDAQLTKILNRSVVDGWLSVTDEQAYTMARRLAREEGIFAGISSGTAVHAAVEVARGLPKGSRVLTILPDTGERYLEDELWTAL
ncbi:MAG: cysteine synthase A [Firmicutes bacterium]|nr:cysteine synthase A [Bacillota bacterium]